MSDTHPHKWMHTQIPRQSDQCRTGNHVYFSHPLSSISESKAHKDFFIIQGLTEKNTVNICGCVLWSDLCDHAALTTTQTQILKFLSWNKQIYFWQRTTRKQIFLFKIGECMCTRLVHNKLQCLQAGFRSLTSSGCRGGRVSWVLVIAGNGSGIFSFGGVYVLH